MLPNYQPALISAGPSPECFGHHLHRRRSYLLYRGGVRRRSPRYSVFSYAQSREPQREQQLKFSVLRFTLGIPGLDESYLPRWIGMAFGSLILLNHFMSSSPAPTQIRSEALGICLAAFSTTIPYYGKFLKGENPVDRSTLPEGNQQIFIMSDNLLDSQKEDFAWASYVLLRNTNTMSVLIMVEEASCVRGYWNMPEGISKMQILELLKHQVGEAGFLDLKNTLYFPEKPDSELQQMLPKGTLSLLVQPVAVNSSALDDDRTNTKGILLLASSANYAYSDKDASWIRAISNKFLGSAEEIRTEATATVVVSVWPISIGNYLYRIMPHSIGSTPGKCAPENEA